MNDRALRFGGVVEAYERFRPGYPAEIVEVVTAYASRPLRTALEIGAGTGKATRLFARAGVAVTASEPDSAMLEVLRRQVPDVTTLHAAFEDLPVNETFDLVYSAAALHWTTSEGRWTRMAGLLRPDGVFANFGGPLRLADPSVEHAARTARAPFLASDEVPSPDGTAPDCALQWPGTELLRSDSFGDVQQSVIERPLVMSAHDYVGYLTTVSAYLELPAAVRQQVYNRILDVLPRRVDVVADLTVHLARRRDRS